MVRRLSCCVLCIFQEGLELLLATLHNCIYTSRTDTVFIINLKCPTNFSVSQQFFKYGSKFEIAKGYNYRNLLENLFNLDLGGKWGVLRSRRIFTTQGHLNHRNFHLKSP